jgi:hypothetical protein
MARETNGGIQGVKAARNQALWREVNERIRAVAETAEHMEFLCECADLDCTETLNLTVAEYERIRSSGVRFPIASGHDFFPEFENVVEENDGYVVVQKIGIAAEEAERLDPRSQAEQGLAKRGELYPWPARSVPHKEDRASSARLRVQPPASPLPQRAVLKNSITRSISSETKA